MVLPVAASPSPDLCVIGGGTAGHAVALAAAALGATCTLIDPRPRLGGGQAADLAAAMVIAAAHRHWHRGRPDQPFDGAAFARRLGGALADLAPNHAAERLRTVGVHIIVGAGAFADARTVVVNRTSIRAGRVILAAGAERPHPAWAQALDPKTLLRFADLGTMAARPAHLVVVTDGADGFAMAQAARRLGSAVTLVATPGAMAAFDAELVAPLLAALRREGIAMHLDSHVAAAETGADGARLQIVRADGDTSPVWLDLASHVLIMSRPAPATARLGLAKGGIANAEGVPVVDRAYRTSNRRVFAIGDIIGGFDSGSAAIPRQVGIVLRAALFRLPVLRTSPAPIALATEPALAQVGDMASAATFGRHREAPERRGDPGARTAMMVRRASLAMTHGFAHRTAALRILRWPLAETALGTTAEDPIGAVKVVATPGGRIIGAGIVGPGAADAIGPWTLALARRIPLQDMASLGVPAASLSEAGRRAALGFVTVRLRGPWIRRLLAAIRRFR